MNPTQHPQFELFQKLISNMPMIFYALDTNWIFKLSEGKGLEKLGLQPSQVIGLSAKEMYQDYPDIINAIELALSGKEVHTEHRLGDYYLENYIIPSYTNQGEISGILAATIDITERKNAELELEKTRKIQEAILNSAPGMVYLYNNRGELVYWNKNHEALTGYTHDELNHFLLSDWFKDDPKGLERVMQGIHRTLSEGYGDAEALLTTKDGKQIPFYFTACPVEIDEKTYFTGIGQSVASFKLIQTQLEEMNQTLEEKVILRTRELNESNEELSAMNEEINAMNEELLDKNEKILSMQKHLVQSEKMAALGNLVAGVAHEINTPVGIGITASSYLSDLCKELIERSQKDSLNSSSFSEYLEDIQQASNMIQSNLERAGKLIHSFKQLSADQVSEPKRIFDIGSYLEEILISLSPSLKKTKIKINSSYENNLFINGSPGAFAQIITNLVMNSIHHAYDPDQNGEINITLSLEKQKIKLLYQDNGKGMSEDIVSKIFDPFFTTKRSHGGTGLGLSIVHSIVVQQFKGSIHCESVLQEGTRFIIYLNSYQGGSSHEHN